MENLTILDNSEPFAQFHSKFWGTSMAVEESEWRSAQTPLSNMESELEINPGCYMLDISIEGLPFPKIWIRAEYIRIFAYLEYHYNHERVHNLAPSVVITGQPGIGEFLVASWPRFY